MNLISSFQTSDFILQFFPLLVPSFRFGMDVRTFSSRLKWQPIIPALLIFVTLFSTSAIAQTPHFDQLKQRFSDGQVFVAEFDHTYTDSYTGEVVESEGNIWIDKERYKLESGGQTIVVDGEISRVYDDNRNRVIVDNYNPEDDDFAPSRMLSGIDSTYTVSEEQAGENTKIILKSTDDFAVFLRVEIVINNESHPLKISAWDISENEIVTNFNNGRFTDSESGLFELEYPEDAELVDMRI